MSSLLLALFLTAHAQTVDADCAVGAGGWHCAEPGGTFFQTCSHGRFRSAVTGSCEGWPNWPFIGGVMVGKSTPVEVQVGPVNGVCEGAALQSALDTVLASDEYLKVSIDPTCGAVLIDEPLQVGSYTVVDGGDVPISPSVNFVNPTDPLFKRALVYVARSTANLSSPTERFSCANTTFSDYVVLKHLKLVGGVAVQGVYAWSAYNLTIRDSSIEGSGGGDGAGINTIACAARRTERVEISRNDIFGWGGGIALRSEWASAPTEWVLVEQNYLHHNGSFNLNSHASNAEYVGNWLGRNTSEFPGFKIVGVTDYDPTDGEEVGAHTSVFHHNAVVDHRRAGGVVFGKMDTGSPVVFTNNLFAGNGHQGIELWGGAAACLEDNDWDFAFAEGRLSTNGHRASLPRDGGVSQNYPNGTVVGLQNHCDANYAYAYACPPGADEVVFHGDDANLGIAQQSLTWLEYNPPATGSYGVGVGSCPAYWQ